jgi:predicted ATP-binding protein involved in virulence
MEILRLKLNNFRGFRDVEFSFCDKVNLIVGINGTGKTSVLESIALSMSWLISRTINERGQGQSIEELSIRNGARESAISIGVRHLGNDYDWQITKARKGHPSVRFRTDLTGLNVLAKSFQAALEQEGGSASLPLVVYYPVNRAIVDIPLRIRGHREFNQLSAFDEALKSAANFRRFFEWYRYQQEKMYAALVEGLLFQKNDVQGGTLVDGKIGIEGNQLEAVRLAIHKFMPGFSDLRIVYNPLRMIVRKNERTLNLFQLSGGEKCILAMVGDLARRLTLANPHLPNPLEGEAIVLIDELDLHLHPVWQRVVINQISSVFPNCQFIISTHSPHIITHVKPECITAISMEENGGVRVHPIQNSYGYTANRLLEEVMGLDTTRPSDVQSQIDDIFKLLSSNDLKNAEKIISSLGATLETDADFVRAKALLARKKVVGK